MPPATLSKRWKKGGFIQLLSGMTLEPSKAQDGVEKWILSLEVSPASLSALSENNWGIKIPGTSGLTLSASLAKCDPDTYSLKMFQASLDGSLAIFSTTLPNWGIMLHGVLWGLPTWAHPIEGNGGFYLPRWNQPRPMEPPKLIPTPTAGDHKRFNHHHQGGPGNLTLHGHASLFPTPNARDWKGPLSKKSIEVKKFSPRLPDLAKEWKKTDGMGSSTNGGRLNPEWVAWLMGLPIGWIK